METGKVTMRRTIQLFYPAQNWVLTNLPEGADAEFVAREITIHIDPRRGDVFTMRSEETPGEWKTSYRMSVPNRVFVPSGCAVITELARYTWGRGKLEVL